jgi:hypothetical protein
VTAAAIAASIAATAVSDTARPAARAVDRLIFATTDMDLVHFIERWHDFFLLAGTAAVTLVGLLFLALSLNLDALLHDSKAHLLDYARATMLSYTFVLITSLAFLIPQQSLFVVAIMSSIYSAIALGIMTVQFVRRWGSKVATQERFLRRRRGMLVVGYLLALTNGVRMAFSNDPRLIYNMVGIVCLMLGNAVGTSWDLLIEVAKAKQRRAATIE